MKKHIATLAPTLLVCTALMACSPINLIVGTGATAGALALGDAGFDVGLTDAKINLEVSKRLAQNSTQYFTEVDVEVHEGRVLLTGTVKTDDQRLNATAIAWKTPAVQEVINKIRVGNTVSVGQKAKDSVMTLSLASALTFDKDVHAVNYKISVINAHAYVMGVAQTRAESVRVTAHIRNTKNIQNFTTDILLADDERRSQNLQAIREYLDIIKQQNQQQKQAQQTSQPTTTQPANTQNGKQSMQKFVTPK